MSIASILAARAREVPPLPEQPFMARTAAATYAYKGPLKKSRFRDERALRFQRWYDTSPYRMRTVCPPEAWREYERQQRHVRISAA